MGTSSVAGSSETVSVGFGGKEGVGVGRLKASCLSPSEKLCAMHLPTGIVFEWSMLQLPGGVPASFRCYTSLSVSIVPSKCLS